MENTQLLNDEILALESIYETDLLFMKEDKRQGRFLAHPTLPTTPYIVSFVEKGISLMT